MKRIAGITVLLSWFIVSCARAPEYIAVPAYLFTPSTANTQPSVIETPGRQEILSLPLDVNWQIQYSGEIDLTLDVGVYNLDLFDTNPEVISQLHQRGIFVMCYFSAGSFEDWREDSNQFPQEVLGKDMEGWPGEKWLDIRQIGALKSVMESRLDVASQKDCDGVDPDNVNGYENDTGFPLTYEDQLQFNIWLAESAHARGLLIGMKNDGGQIPDLVSYFDWQLNEECFQYDECEMLLPFIEAGKPVFDIEYTLSPDDFCPQSSEMGINSIRKNLILDAYVEACE